MLGGKVTGGCCRHFRRYRSVALGFGGGSLFLCRVQEVSLVTTSIIIVSETDLIGRRKRLITARYARWYPLTSG
jgi:hypothetical protein